MIVIISHETKCKSTTEYLIVIYTVYFLYSEWFFISVKKITTIEWNVRKWKTD